MVFLRYELVRHALPVMWRTGILKMSAERLINEATPVPKYYQIQLILQDRVESGTWPPGQTIPSERKLCLEFGVSRPTIRQALGNLAVAGFLRKEHGKGNFVCRPKLLEKTLTPGGHSTYQSWQKRGFKFTVRVLSKAIVISPEHICRKLQLGPDELSVKIERLLVVGAEVIRHVTTFIPHRLCPDIIEKDLSRESLIRILEDHYSMSMHETQQFLQVQPASSLDMHWMQIRPNTPVFVLQSINFDAEGRPLWIDFDRARSDRVMFEVRTTENGATKEGLARLVLSANNQKEAFVC